MFSVPLVLSGLSLLGYEVYNYFGYKKTVEFSKNKKKSEILDINNKSTWMINYILNLSKEDLSDWVINNIKSKHTMRLEDISFNRITKCLSFNIYYQSYKKLDYELKERINKVVIEIENKLDIIFKHIPDDNLTYYKFGHNEIISTYKPALFYSILGIIKKYTYNRLVDSGFIMHKVGNIVYFYKKVNEDTTANMFIHGLGFGSTPYLDFILEMSINQNLIIPILPNISNMEFVVSELTGNNMFPEYETIISNFREIISVHNISKLNISAHSFGTIIASILIQDEEINKIVGKKILVDPVCFIEKCYKIFRYIDNPDDRGSTINKIFNEVVYNDIYVKYATQRFLCGPKYWIYDYSILNDCLIVLSGKDRIVPSYEIAVSAREKNIPCLISEDAEHGDIFLSKYSHVQNFIIDFIKN